MPVHTTKPPSWLKPDAGQSRTLSSPEDDRQLIESVRRYGVLQAVGALVCGRLIWGHRRLAAAIAAGLGEIPVVVLEKPMTEGEFHLMQGVENFARLDLSPNDQWQTVEKAFTLCPGMTNKELAARFGKSESMICRLRSPSKTIPAAQQALKDGRICINHCCRLSQCATEAEQAAMLDKMLGGASTPEVERAIRTRRNGAAETVQVERLRCALPSGVSVTFAGEGISLETAISAMQELTRELKRAIEQGLSAATVVKALKDKACVK